MSRLLPSCSRRVLRVVLAWLAVYSSVNQSHCQDGDALRRFAFQRVKLNAQSEFSACCVFDVNRDGQVDIYCGGFWYEGPHWTRHVTREVRQIRGRYDDYSNLPLDMNGDGWLDVVSVNYRSKSIYWCENPRETDGTWRTHLIDEPGTSETGILADVDADGRTDVLPNGTSFAAWYRRDLSSNDTLVRQIIPDEMAGHGIGIGDLDGDGLPDLITPRGWWKQVKADSQSKWIPQSGFRLHNDASIPILVHDVDQDGDADVIWGRGHNVGLYWLEHQQRDARVHWVLHPIDTSYSCAHHLKLADLNQDGEVELIVGRRYLGHDGKDPGEWMPLEMHAYTFQRDRGTWRDEMLSWGGASGFDLNAACDDIDGDGDLDIVAATRAGLDLLINRSNEESRVSEQLAPTRAMAWPTYAANEPLLQLRDEDNAAVRSVTTFTDWGYRRAQILKNMERVMGELPDSSRRASLDVRREAETQCEGYRRIQISFRADFNSRVTAYLLIPDSVAMMPAPAMLCLHPTHSLGKGVVCGLAEVPNRSYAHELAQQGFVCLAPDYPSFGDDAFEFAQHTDYVSGTMKAIWNNLRAIDLLESLPEVDGDRIGCIGHSLGGHNALFTAAFDMRLRAVVTSCGFTSFADYYGGNLAGWTSDRYMPRIRTKFDLDSNQMPFDFHEVMAAIAPRPIFVCAPVRDDNFAVAGVKKTLDRVNPVYELFQAGERIVARYPDAGHDFPDDIRSEVYAWLKRQFAAN